MKNYLPIFPSVLLGILLLTSACHKRTLISIDQATRDHFYFKKGSWWIYQDTITLAYDTFLVTENTERIVNDGSRYAENEYQVLTSVVRWHTSNQLLVTLNNKNEVNFQFRGPGNFVTNASFAYPFADPASFYPIGYNYQPYFFPNFTVGSVTYRNVHRIEGNDEYYINDSIGLVKAVISNPDKSINIAWWLVNCKIIK